MIDIYEMIRQAELDLDAAQAYLEVALREEENDLVLDQYIEEVWHCRYVLDCLWQPGY